MDGWVGGLEEKGVLSGKGEGVVLRVLVDGEITCTRLVFDRVRSIVETQKFITLTIDKCRQ